MNVWVSIITFKASFAQENARTEDHKIAATFASADAMSEYNFQYIVNNVHKLDTTLYRVAQALIKHKEKSLLLELWNKHSGCKIETFKTKMHHPLT